MEEDPIIRHINLMYPNWRDLCKIICAPQHLIHESDDILHEVLLYILVKKRDELVRLYQKEEKGYKALDCIVVHIIKKYAQSPTAPYRQRYHRQVRINNNIQLDKLNLPELAPQEDLFQQIVNIFNQMDLLPKERDVFRFIFIENHKLSEWQGPESISTLSRICTRIIVPLQKKVKTTGIKKN